MNPSRLLNSFAARGVRRSGPIPVGSPLKTPDTICPQPRFSSNPSRSTRPALTSHCFSSQPPSYASEPSELKPSRKRKKDNKAAVEQDISPSRTTSDSEKQTPIPRSQHHPEAPIPVPHARQAFQRDQERTSSSGAGSGLRSSSSTSKPSEESPKKPINIESARFDTPSAEEETPFSKWKGKEKEGRKIPGSSDEEPTSSSQALGIEGETSYSMPESFRSVSPMELPSSSDSGFRADIFPSLSLTPSNESSSNESNSSGEVGNPINQHPFDTHAFVTKLSKAGFDEDSAKELMRATEALLMEQEKKVRERMLDKGALENEAYLFTAALSELKTEAQVKTRNDTIALRSMTSVLQREVDTLTQKMREDFHSLKNEIQIDLNSRKEESQTENKNLDLRLVELQNDYSMVLGDIRTEIEATKWITTRRVMSALVFVVASVIIYNTVADAMNPQPPPTAEELGLHGVGDEPDHEDTVSGIWKSAQGAAGSGMNVKRVGEEEEGGRS